MSPTKIEWAEDVLNIITGCSPISEGCAHCWAKNFAHRLAGRGGYDRLDPFAVTFHADKLFVPSRRRQPTRFFVSSMGDFFHGSVPDEWRELMKPNAAGQRPAAQEDAKHE